MKYLIQRIAEYLYEHGDSSTQEVAKGLGEPTARVAGAVKPESARARWGIIRVGYVTKAHGRGHAPSIWGIQKAVYRQFLSERRDMPWIAKRVFAAKPPKPVAKSKVSVKVPKEPIVPLSERRVYTGPMLTRWQPSSPYFKDTL